MRYPHEPARSEAIEHDVLVSWDKAATAVLWPALAEEGFEPPSTEESANTTRALVWEVQRLRQVIAIRAQEDRIAEQIEQGYR